MHPALIVLIAVGVPLAIWGAYEGGSYAHRKWSEYQEEREYAEFVRRANSEKMHAPAGRTSSFDDDDDEDEFDDDNEPLAYSAWRRGYGELRNRRQKSPNVMNESWDYELSEMEKSIMERRERLRQEEEQIRQEEQDLQRRRQSIQTRGNSIIGVPDQNQQPYNPFASLDSSMQTEVPQRPDFDHVPSFFAPQPSAEENPFASSDRFMSSSSSSSASELGRDPFSDDQRTSVVSETPQQQPQEEHHDNSQQQLHDSHEGLMESLRQDLEGLQTEDDDGDDEAPSHHQRNHLSSSRGVSDSEDSWSDLDRDSSLGHSRQTSDANDSIRTPPPPPPAEDYGVLSMSSEDEEDHRR